MQSKPVWGILGCGNISGSFVRSLFQIPDTQIKACSSKDLARAKKFAEEFQIDSFYDDYETMLNDPSIDVIYIGTTHNDHFKNVQLCLEYKKAVLCEKPFCVNAYQAKQLFKKARESQIFIMEAMWSRFLPALIDVFDIIHRGKIGEVRHVKADFGIQVPIDYNNRWFNKELAGGALLDLGIYPLFLSRMVHGSKPVKISSTARIGSTGVDEESHYFLEYPNSATSMLSSTFTMKMPHDATIYGSEGVLSITDFFHPHSYAVLSYKGASEKIEKPHELPGYKYEAEEVIRCMQQGLLESPLMPHSLTIDMLELMDSLRSQWGLKYDFEDFE